MVVRASFVGALLLCASSGSGIAQLPAEFYSRTSVRLIIAADPGGSYDQVGRLLARQSRQAHPRQPAGRPREHAGRLTTR
jgi:tripartite-type tricarboxylate transporter receptor subunit TctC